MPTRKIAQGGACEKRRSAWNRYWSASPTMYLAVGEVADRRLPRRVLHIVDDNTTHLPASPVSRFDDTITETEGSFGLIYLSDPVRRSCRRTLTGSLKQVLKYLLLLCDLALGDCGQPLSLTLPAVRSSLQDALSHPFSCPLGRQCPCPGHGHGGSDNRGISPAGVWLRQQPDKDPDVHLRPEQARDQPCYCRGCKLPLSPRECFPRGRQSANPDLPSSTPAAARPSSSTRA